ncbi:TylF/MycF/NovP-related O-methyltransferase [Parafilimonas sp.]|uniref:TylF/MycF/NovP-related O-methyltransferase n=1 Tax=Parafilimonas sp. TaxID=1969739 RepID=UPI003F81B402
MKYPQNCIVKKGYFPESAADVDNRFCFVSLDANLYKPLLSSLQFFYPRLENKGYIFVHDFNNDLNKIARQAVIEFYSLTNISYMPIPDGCGKAIITK